MFKGESEMIRLFYHYDLVIPVLIISRSPSHIYHMILIARSLLEIW